MKKLFILAFFLIPALMLTGSGHSRAGEMKTIQLPKPQMDIGRPLMQVLKDRMTSRTFGKETLTPQVLSNLLWAAAGVNRPDSGKRTAPTALNRQEIDIFVATADGLYLFDPKEHSLKQVLAEDVRALTGRQGYVAEAPVNLVYVADLSRMSKEDSAENEFYAAADTGFIGQNVYLFCASEGLATVVRGAIDRPALARAMKLREDQKITLAQSVGYPKKPN